jgi:protein SCO1/2
VDIVEKLGVEVPRGLAFTTAEGERVTLGAMLDGSKPVILTFNYASCPMLCSLQLNGMVQSLKQIERRLGKDFEVVTVILDPKETPAGALAMKARYLASYLGANPDPSDAAAASQGWRFLTGAESEIKAAAEAVGFGYGFNEERGEYLHPAALTLLTPSGKVARYLYGIEYHPKTVSLSLVDVSEGKIGGSMEKILLYCFHYDETEGRYAPVAVNIMRLGGGLTALVLSGFLGRSWIRESRKQRAQAAG